MRVRGVRLRLRVRVMARLSSLAESHLSNPFPDRQGILSSQCTELGQSVMSTADWITNRLAKSCTMDHSADQLSLGRPVREQKMERKRATKDGMTLDRGLIWQKMIAQEAPRWPNCFMLELCWSGRKFDRIFLRSRMRDSLAVFSRRMKFNLISGTRSKFISLANRSNGDSSFQLGKQTWLI